MDETTGATPDQIGEAPRHASAEVWPGSHTPLADPAEAPEGFPIKGNADSGLYHVPGSPFYDRTVAEVWFASAEAAEAAGFQLPPSQRQEAEPVAESAPAEPEPVPVAEPEPEPASEPEPVAAQTAEAEPAAIAPEAAPEAEPATIAAESAPAPEPEPEPEPVARTPYVSSFADTGATPSGLAAAGNPLVKRLLVSLGAGAIAFLVLRRGLRGRG